MSGALSIRPGLPGRSSGAPGAPGAPGATNTRSVKVGGASPGALRGLFGALPDREISLQGNGYRRRGFRGLTFNIPYIGDTPNSPIYENGFRRPRAPRSSCARALLAAISSSSMGGSMLSSIEDPPSSTDSSGGARRVGAGLSSRISSSRSRAAEWPSVPAPPGGWGGGSPRGSRDHGGSDRCGSRSLRCVEVFAPGGRSLQEAPSPLRRSFVGGWGTGRARLFRDSSTAVSAAPLFSLTRRTLVYKGF